MSETKKYFLDFGGLQTLWDKMKNTFAAKNTVDVLSESLDKAEENIVNLNKDIDIVEAIALSYVPKVVKKYSDALAIVDKVSAGQIFVVGNDEGTYKKGFYIVDNDKTLHYIGTTIDGSDSEITALRDRILTLEGQIITAGNIQTSNGTVLSGITITDNSLIMIYDNEVVADTQSVNALTHRAIAAKFRDIEGMISAVPKFKIDVVDHLPAVGWSLSTIYLVKNTDEQSDNMYTEYIYVENKGWEKLGEQKIVLDDYVTKEFLRTEINNALSILSNYAKKTEVSEMISNSKDEILGIISSNYASKDDVIDKMTEEEIIISIQNGNIGNSITISEEQINALI